jgi:hypothetical protein
LFPLTVWVTWQETLFGHASLLTRSAVYQT